jgi:hypothetical protein
MKHNYQNNLILNYEKKKLGCRRVKLKKKTQTQNTIIVNTIFFIKKKHSYTL